jgi:hypothetical protein
MTAEIIHFPERTPKQPPPSEGGGALDVVRDYLARVNPARVMARAVLDKGDGFEGIDALPDADHFLAWLWEQGFKVIPVDESDVS